MFSSPQSRNPFLSNAEPPPVPPPRSLGQLACVRLNPFRDPTTSDRVYAKPRDTKKKDSNNPYYMSGAIHDDEPSDTSKSGDTERSIGTESTIDGSYMHPFASTRDDGTEVNGRESYTVDNVFVEPPPHRVNKTDTATLNKTEPLFDPSRNLRPIFSSAILQIQKFKNKIYLAPIKESPPSHGPQNRFSAGLKRSSAGTESTRTRDRQLLKAAAHQNQLLENERRRSAALFLETPRLYPSPRIRPRLGSTTGLTKTNIFSSVHDPFSTSFSHNDEENGNRNGVSPKASDRRRVLRSSTFWIFFCLIQVGLVSTGAAVAILLRDKTPSERVHASAGTVMWLVISILAILIGSIGALCVWGIGKEGCVDLMGRIGFAELGLIPDIGSSEMEKSLKEREREEEEIRMKKRLERVRERERTRVRNLGRTDTMSSIRTINPEWQALYTTPEELRRKPKWGGNDGGRTDAIEMEIFAGEEVRKTPRKTSNPRGVESLFGGGMPLIEFKECDVGMQLLTPTKRVSDACTLSRHQQSQNPNASNGEHRFPFSKFQGRKITSDEDFTPQYLRGRKRSAPAANKGEDVAPLDAAIPVGNLHRELSKHLSKDFRITPLMPSPEPSSPSAREGSKEEKGFSHSSSVDLYTNLAVNQSQQQYQNWTTHNNSNRSPPLEQLTPLDSFSPLEILARELNTPELRSPSAEKRVDYFVERRSLNDERGRKMRESVERGESFSGSLGWRNNAHCAEVKEAEVEIDEFCNRTRDLGPRDVVDRDESRSMSGKLSEVGEGLASASLPTMTNAPGVELSGGFQLEKAVLLSSLESHPESLPDHRDAEVEPKKSVNSLTVRKLSPTIMERVRNLEERDRDCELRSTSTTSLGSENGWIGMGLKNLSARNGSGGGRV